MNKTRIARELRGLFNSTRTVAGVHVARVAWDDNSYKVVKDGLTFDDVVKTKDGAPLWEGAPVRKKIRIHKPIAEFYYQKELVAYILNHQTV